MKGINKIKDFVKTVSSSPGVYRMIDEDGKVLYVGKAKNLKNRINNYTNYNNLNSRLKKMVSRTFNMEVIETNTEIEAFLLECNLIKSLNPYYNILLRDDKTFPHISFSKKHEFPRILKSRNLNNKSYEHFGPFVNVGALDRTLKLIRNVYKIRNCTDNEFLSRQKPCIEYQIKKCSAPCVNKISKDEYDKSIFNAKSFLRGKSDDLKNMLRDKMLEASENLHFEQAKIYRDLLQDLNNITTTQDVNVSGIGDTDFFAIYKENGKIIVNVFFYRASRHQGSLFYIFDDTLEKEEKIIQDTILQFYSEKQIVKNIVTNINLEDSDLIQEAMSQRHKIKINFKVPKYGKEKDIVNYCYNNAVSTLKREISKNKNNQENIHKLESVLGIKNIDRIEVYDNSHTQGNNPVGAMIVASKDGFLKDQYRSWNIKSSMLKKDGSNVAGDDYTMMKEVFSRRFKTKNKDNIVIPDLVIIDGGLGQYSSAKKVFDELEFDVNYIAIAKSEGRNSGKEKIYYKDIQIDILPKSQIHFFLERLRDEAHRFAINRHVKKRDKSLFASPLDSIEGIGALRKKKLLNYFGSAKEIMNANVKDIEKVDGISKKMAQNIYSYFHEQ